MLKLRTKLLFLAMVVSGIGIGVLSGLADGAYSAICLFVLPLFVALAALSVIADFNRAPVPKTQPVINRPEQQAPAWQSKEVYREWVSQ